MKDDRNKIRLKNKDCWSKGVQPISERYPIQDLYQWDYTFKWYVEI